MNSRTTVPTDTALVLLGHGSRDPLWRGPIESLAARVTQLSPGMAVRCAYLEWANPDLAQAVEELLALGHVRIRLFPLVFGSTTLATTPLPIMITIAVPNNSAINGVIFFYFYCLPMIGCFYSALPTLNTFCSLLLFNIWRKRFINLPH